MVTKLALLLLALAIGGLALCDARPSGRSLLASADFSCGGGGEAFNGNNRPGTLPTCAGGSFLCRTGDCSGTCTATCNDPGRTTLTLTRNADGTITVKKGADVVDVDNGIYKGCNAYCVYGAAGTPGVPIRSDGSLCGLSHADFCYTPCRCEKDLVTFTTNDGKPVADVSLCPGDALPDRTNYKAVDNCGKTLPVTVTDSSKVPEGGPCGTITRTLAASCGAVEATKLQKITYEDTPITFSSACPVVGSSKCLAGKDLTPVVSYVGCVFKAEYKLENACGVESTKTVTCPGGCGP